MSISSANILRSRASRSRRPAPTRCSAWNGCAVRSRRGLCKTSPPGQVRAGVLPDSYLNAAGLGAVPGAELPKIRLLPNEKVAPAIAFPTATKRPRAMPGLQSRGGWLLLPVIRRSRADGRSRAGGAVAEDLVVAERHARSADCSV